MGMSLNLRLDLMQRKIDELSAIASNLPVSDFDDGSASYFMISGIADTTTGQGCGQELFLMKDINVYGEWGEDPRADPASKTETITVYHGGEPVAGGRECHAIYSPGIHPDTNWALHAPGGQCIIGKSTGGSAATYASGTITPGCINVTPFVVPDRYSMDLAYSSYKAVAEPPNYHSPTREYKKDTPDRVAVAAPVYDAQQSYEEDDEVSYPHPGVNHEPGKLWRATEGTSNEPGTSGWTLVDDCYLPDIWEATADHDAGAWDYDDTGGWTKLDSECQRLSRYTVDPQFNPVDAVPAFSTGSGYGSGDHVQHAGGRYEANSTVTANAENNPSTDAAWTEVSIFQEAFDGEIQWIREQSLTVSGTQVSWEHGMMFEPGNGHYVNGVDGVLTWYDCDPLPDQTCDSSGGFVAWGVVADDISAMTVPPSGSECFSPGTGKVFVARMVDACLELTNSKPDDHPDYDPTQTYYTGGTKVIHDNTVYELKESGTGVTGTFDAADWNDLGGVAAYHDSDEGDNYAPGDRVVYGGKMFERVNPCGDVDENGVNLCDGGEGGNTKLPGDPDTVTCATGGECPSGMGQGGLMLWKLVEDLSEEATNITKVIIPGGTVVQLTGDSSPYAASFANPDEFLAMLDTYTIGATQSLYHPPGVRQAIWGGEYCGNDYAQFSSSSLYEVGTIVEHNGRLWVNETAIDGTNNPVGPFDEDDWGDPE